MSKSIAPGLLGAGAILLAILLTGCTGAPSPTPSARAVPSPTVTVQPGVTPEPTATPTATPTPAPTPTMAQTATPTPEPTASTVSFEEYLSACEVLGGVGDYFKEDATNKEFSGAFAELLAGFEAVIPPAEVAEWHNKLLSVLQDVIDIFDLLPEDDTIDFGTGILVGLTLVADMEEVEARLPDDVRRQMVSAGCIEGTSADRFDEPEALVGTFGVGESVRVGDYLVELTDAYMEDEGTVSLEVDFQNAGGSPVPMPDWDTQMSLQDQDGYRYDRASASSSLFGASRAPGEQISPDGTAYYSLDYVDVPEDAVGLTWKFSDGVSGAAFDLTGIGLLQASIEPEPEATPAPTARAVATPTPTMSPETPAGSFVSVSAGRDHTCGIRSDGSVACWGENRAGQATPPAGSFASVSAGEDYTCGVKSDGSVACWGYDYYGQATPPAGSFASVSAGYAHICGVKSDGSVACWGLDNDGQATPPAGSFVSVSAGENHTCGVRSNGSVACWGRNDFGQATPPVGSFVSVSAGEDYTCGVKSDGSVACWGWDFGGQATPPAGSFASVSVGGHTCGVRSDGSVACWGWDWEDQDTPPVGSFVSVSAGGEHTCGVRSNGSVACWGGNEDGQATPPVSGTTLEPTPTPTPPAGSFVSVSAGNLHTCGVRSDGSVDCWGSDENGQAAPPAGSFSPTPSAAAPTPAPTPTPETEPTTPTATPTSAPTPAPAAATLSLDEYLTHCAPPDWELGDDSTYGDFSSLIAAEADRLEALTPPAQLSEWHLLNIENFRTIQAFVDLQPEDEVINFALWFLLPAITADSEEKLSEAAARLPEDILQQMIEAGCIYPEDLPSVIADGSDDHGDDIDDATAIRVGAGAEAAVNYEGDVDYFSFQAEQGQSYQIDVALGSLDDSIVELYDSDGLFLDSNDDYSGSTASRLSWQASSSGELYVVVKAYGSGVGTYTLTVSHSTSSVLEVTDDHGGSAADASAVTVGESIEGAVNYLGDEDVFLFQVEAGAIYEIEVAPGTLADFDLGVYDEPDEWKGGSFSPVLSVETHRNVWRSEYTGDSYLVVGFPGFELGSYTVRVARITLAGNTSYDTDRDGLIEVSRLMQLNAVRWDLDGDGLPDSSSGIAGFAAAFPGALDGMGCPNSECSGYELISDLDFDTNGNGRADAGDAYWNDGEGWAPIGDEFLVAFEAFFDGGGHTISNLYIDRSDANYVGLFGNTGFSGSNYFVGLNNNIRDLALVNVDVQGGSKTGGLVGSNGLVIVACSVTGVVSGGVHVGGLVGNNFSGTVIASYSAASVEGGPRTGGLVGSNFSGTIIASYSIGSVSNDFGDVGGLVGSIFADRGTTRDSYWDTQTSGQSESAGGEGKTTSELQSPTGYTGIYENWNLDLDEDGVGDDLWDFGDASQYPRLRHGS